MKVKDILCYSRFFQCHSPESGSFKALFCAVLIGLFVLFANGNNAMAADTQEQQIMTPVSDIPAWGTPISDLVDHLQLVEYEAVLGDLSLCAGDENCVKHAQRVKSWFCAAALCGTGGMKEPSTCFKKPSRQLSVEAEEQLNTAFCSVIKSPNTETRRAMLSYLPDASEDILVEDGAYFLALNGSALSCEEYITNYVGAYGSQWNYKWFRALSGCRILGHESTREQEEKDFYAWFGVVQGSGKCSDIANSEMRNECYSPGATAAIAAYVAR
jgi:hypothetical protein